MPRSTTARLLLSGSLTLLAIPLTYWVRAARKDPSTMTALMVACAGTGIGGLLHWMSTTAEPDQLQLATGRARSPHVNASGDRVLSIPSALAPLMLRPEYLPLLDAQARNGGLPIPLPPHMLSLIVQLNGEFLQTDRVRDNNQIVGDGQVVRAFLSAVFRSTYQLPEDHPAIVVDAAKKC